MHFSSALKPLTDGKRIRRSEWPRMRCLVPLQFSDLPYSVEPSFALFNEYGYLVTGYQLTASDTLATDWEEY